MKDIKINYVALTVTIIWSIVLFAIFDPVPALTGILTFIILNELFGSKMNKLFTIKKENE